MVTVRARWRVFQPLGRLGAEGGLLFAREPGENEGFEGFVTTPVLLSIVCSHICYYHWCCDSGVGVTIANSYFS